ncbi:hypothetical protein TNCV_2778931 [Trichonephila clavipes]|nr:hypothetical protein TNCV_2778931 [Trichonephila clavipes]
MSNHQLSNDEMSWRIVGRLEAGQSRVQNSTEINYLNSSRILNQSRESLGKVVQQPRWPEKIAICRFLARPNREATAFRLCRYLCAAKRTRVIRVTVKKKNSSREGCLLEDLLLYPNHVYE